MPSTIPFISSPELSIEQRDSVLWLTITREERRNAMSHGVLANMAAAVNQAQSHRDIRAIVVTGAGSKAFCAGADLQSANAFTTDYSEPQGHLAQVLSVLQHLIPRRVLVEMCLTGEPISSAQALEYGLVNYVADDVDAQLDWLLARMLDKSPAAIRRGLYTLKKVESMAFEESLSFTESQIALFTLTEDAKEGQLAFKEKRKPVWSGK